MKKAVLTPKREQFAVAIAGGMTQTDAYKHAYPASLKWKPESVWSKASELMTNVKVLERIEQLRDRLANRTILKRADVLDEIRRLTHSDIAALYNEDGSIKKPHELDADTRAAIASIEITKNGSIKYRFWDKNSAVEKAARVLGLYEKDNKQRADALGQLLDSLSGNVKGVVAQPDTPDGGN